MKSGDIRAIVLNLISSGVLMVIVWLAGEPVAQTLLAIAVANALICAAFVWPLIRFGPFLLRESVMATRRIVVVAVLIALGYVAITEDGPTVVWIMVVAGACCGLSLVLRRTAPQQAS